MSLSPRKLLCSESGTLSRFSAPVLTVGSHRLNNMAEQRRLRRGFGRGRNYTTLQDPPEAAGAVEAAGRQRGTQYGRHGGPDHVRALDPDSDLGLEEV